MASESEEEPFLSSSDDVADEWSDGEYRPSPDDDDDEPASTTRKQQQQQQQKKRSNGSKPKRRSRTPSGGRRRRGARTSAITQKADSSSSDEEEEDPAPDKKVRKAASAASKHNQKIRRMKSKPQPPFAPRKKPRSNGTRRSLRLQASSLRPRRLFVDEDPSASDQDDLRDISEEDGPSNSNRKQQQENDNPILEESSEEDDRKPAAKKCLLQDDNDSGLLEDTPSSEGDSSSSAVEEKYDSESCTTGQHRRHRLMSKSKLKRQQQLREIQREAEELKKDQERSARTSRAAKQKAETPSSEEEDEDETLLPIEPVCRRCIPAQLMRQLQRGSDGRAFFSCRICNSFVWAKAVTHGDLPSGPLCFCGKRSLPIVDRHTREKLWVCSKSGGVPCDFCRAIALDWHERAASIAVPLAQAAAPAVGGNNQEELFLLDARVTQLLQALMHVSFEDSRQLRYGLDVSDRSAPRGYYDYLQVKRAWKIDRPAESVAAFERFRNRQRRVDRDPTLLRAEYAAAVDRLLESESGYLEPLDTRANEVLLLHGTKPRVVANILEQSLDPGMASGGLFGPGTYFAEHPIKSDQYTQKDDGYKGHIRNNLLHRLHNKLYPTATLHPTNVRYALVCRVVLGTPEVTHKTKSRKPTGGHHSYLAELGGDISRFREFVTFDKNSIKIEYLIAYTHTKEYCRCGIPVRRRTMNENGEDRPIIACNNSQRTPSGTWSGGCGLFARLPRCYCSKYSSGDFFDAVKGTDGGYRCRKNRCRFQWNPPVFVDQDIMEGDNSGDSYDTEDTFIAPEGDVEEYSE